MGLSFPNQLGLAAGFIHDGRLLRYSGYTGLGLVEIGTINIDSAIEHDPYVIDIIHDIKNALHTYRYQRWGINLGSLDHSLTQKATADYTKGMKLFWRYADYLVINLSRPGSAVRTLQPDMQSLADFFQSIMEQHSLLKTANTNPIPITVKIAIDHLNNGHIIPVLMLVREYGFDGAIIAFENWPDIESIRRYLGTLRVKLDPFPFIIVGGIRTADDARKILDAGASLVQIYTSLVAYGPAYTKKMALML